MDTLVETKIKKLLLSNLEQLVIDTRLNLNFYQSNEKIRNSLINILQPHYPNVKVYLFGSRIIGTGSHTSDLDIYVDTDGTFHMHGFYEDITGQLNTVYQLLMKFYNEWHEPKIIDSKIPLIKVIYKNENINCDISFSDGPGFRNTKLFKTLCDERPLYRDLIICLRLWMEKAQLSDDFNNCTLRLLVLHYLQQIHFIPSIQVLQETVINPLKIDPWSMDLKIQKFQASDLVISNGLKTHLAGLFKYYSLANLSDNIICTYLGTIVPKECFTGGKDYLNKYDEFWELHKSEMYEFSELNIRGPFHLGQNAAKNVSSEALQRFISLSKTSYLLLISG